MSEILSFFHYIKHNNGKHEVCHYGGKPNEMIALSDYAIKHCSCGKHTIDRSTAFGHTTGVLLDTLNVIVEFSEKCPDGGWHVESGTLSSK